MRDGNRLHSSPFRESPQPLSSLGALCGETREFATENIEVSLLVHMSISPEITADVWRSLRCEWLWVYRGAVPGCGKWSAEIPVPVGVFFVEQGNGRIRVDGKEFTVKRGEAFFSAPGPRRHWFAPGTRLLSVGFRCLWPDGRPVFRRGLNFTAKSPKLRNATLALFHRVHGGRKTVTFREAVKPRARSLAAWVSHEAAFQAWFAVWSETLHHHDIAAEAQRGKARRSRVDQLMEWLDSRPLNATVPTLPRDFALGLRRADQLLQQHLGMSLRGYLERRRLSAACERVLGGEDTLKEIAFELGFRHASHFTAWFRRHTGLSPSIYRAHGGVAV